MIVFVFLFGIIIGLPLFILGSYSLWKGLQSVVSLAIGWPDLVRRFPTTHKNTGALLRSFNFSSIKFGSLANFTKCMQVSMTEKGLLIHPSFFGKSAFIPWEEFTFAGLEAGLDDGFKFGFSRKEYPFMVGLDEIKMYGRTGEDVQAFCHHYLT